ncbi:MAG: GntP family permease [Planctomycetota bacterium]|nr:MAG: GntP family permease [Planctomycetota bacterium]REK23491.1 MAG: GntP family permease [Planctomycetota bacterium]REK38984.1 MAG: GntP family permease [Planctomycetota bacterium]
MTSIWVTLAVLLSGVCVVVGGVLWMRLHAFLALTLGALVVAALTPAGAIERFNVRRLSVNVLDFDPTAETLILKGKPSAGLGPGTVLEIADLTAADGHPALLGQVVIEEILPKTTEDKEDRVLAIRQGEWSMAGLDPGFDGLAVIDPIDFGRAVSTSKQTIGERVAEGFGRTCAGIGILIALAAIIGKCLLDSGAADRIVRTALKWFGEPGAPAAFMLSGFLLGIPVFFDTVFYLMMPLGKALRVRTGRNYLVYVLTIVCGGTMAHSLVPPTPGPLFVADELGVSLATMIVGGGIVGLACGTFGYVYATIAGKIWDLPLRDTGEVSLEELSAAAEVDERELPPLWLSLAPILLPVLLIMANAVTETLGHSPHWLQTLGNKNIALGIAAAVGLLTLVWQKRQSRRELAKGVGVALESGGVIILITAAGGAFGGVLRETGVAELIRDLPRSSPAMICVLAFFITTAIRTAQGSATVAMITAVGVLSGLAKGGELGFHPVYLALAIGCGSKPIAWMNDSGFWVITKMSGMTEGEGLKYITPMTASMGLVGLLMVVIGVTLFPMTP